MIILLMLASLCLAHDLKHVFSKEGNCVVLNFYFSDGAKFSYESYQVFRPKENIPFQVGKTDSLGRVVFCPDKPGNWTVKTFSEDGHGAIIEFNVESVTHNQREGGFSNYQKILIGGGFVLGIFGLLDIYLRRFLPWLRKHI